MVCSLKAPKCPHVHAKCALASALGGFRDFLACVPWSSASSHPLGPCAFSGGLGETEVGVNSSLPKLPETQSTGRRRQFLGHHCTASLIPTSPFSHPLSSCISHEREARACPVDVALTLTALSSTDRLFPMDCPTTEEASGAGGLLGCSCRAHSAPSGHDAVLVWRAMTGPAWASAPKFWLSTGTAPESHSSPGVSCLGEARPGVSGS